MALDIPQQKYDEARKLIDLNLTATKLPDSTVEMSVFKQTAIDYVKSKTDNEDALASRAALYYLASLLCGIVPDIVSQSNAGFSWQKSKTDFVAKAGELEAKAQELIAESERLNPTATGSLSENDFPGFDVAERQRVTPMQGVDIFDA